MRVLLLQGEFEGWYTLPTGVRTYTVKFPGPDPFTETHVSVLPQVGEALETIPLGKQVRVIVEVVE